MIRSITGNVRISFSLWVLFDTMQALLLTSDPMWLIACAFIAPLLHGLASVFDNYLTNKLFRNAWTLAFYCTIINILFLPLIFLWEMPGLPPFELLPYFLLIGLIEILYPYPYYKSLQNDDTSIVSALFAIGKIFVPLLAFLLVGERLELVQYIGFFIIILSSAVLTLHTVKKVRLNQSLVYMTICSLLLALEAVIYKYLFANVSWSTGFVWTLLFSSLLSLSFLLLPKLRRDIKDEVKNMLNHFPIIAGQELLTFGGTAAATYVISAIPVTIAAAIGSFQPFFVLLYAILFSRVYPYLFKERMDRSSIVKKCILFAVMIVGIVLIVR